MSQTGYTVIQHYRTDTAGAVPSAGNIAKGELGINTADRKLYTKNATGFVVSVGGGGATGGDADQVFFENDQAVTADYTITTGKNAMTAGPITIESGVTVVVPSGSTWTIV